MSSSSYPQSADIGIVTVIPVELAAVLHALGISERERSKDECSGTVTYRGVVHSSLRGRDYCVVVACIAGAGNAGAAGLTTEIARAFRPLRMFLVGIAAGMETKNRIGEVVFAERIVAYEPAALVVKDGGEREEQRRPEIAEVPHTVRQDVTAYEVDIERLRERFAGYRWEIPNDPSWEGKVVTTVQVSKGVTIASGEKLLRDQKKLRDVRAEIHGKVEAGEMEAYGFAKACEQQGIPWLVIRGISDFGDSFKDDRFHSLAARAASTVVVDFLEQGLDLGGGTPAQTAPKVTPSPFTWGCPEAC